MTKIFAGILCALLFCCLAAPESLAYYRERLSSQQAVDDGKAVSEIPLASQATPALQAMPSLKEGLVSIGTPVKTPIASRGDSIPLRQAALLIVPSEWKTIVDQSIGEIRVSWNAKDRDWADVMDEVARQAGVCAVANWNDRTLHLQAVPKLGLSASDAPTPSPDTTQFYRITPGRLKAQMSAWAARAGYQLVWDVPHDYEMRAAADFSTDFRESVQSLFVGLQRSGYALRVTVHPPNRVLEVKGN
ncbi:MAG: toxin co-regulated pilus biosynthesis Q family protein [Deltaproteobacteria bacterium]|nr:toxin co-regulated pilus biosynthesis Q family protein [Deltaproteobacteria bacterium]